MQQRIFVIMKDDYYLEGFVSSLSDTKLEWKKDFYWARIFNNQFDAAKYKNNHNVDGEIFAIDIIPYSIKISE